MNLKNNIAVSDSGFVFNPASGESFSVNPVGIEMLNLLRKGNSDAEIINHFEKNYVAERSQIERDLHDFIEMMKQYHLIQHEDE
jgi:hypothetical protein